MTIFHKSRYICERDILKDFVCGNARQEALFSIFQFPLIRSVCPPHFASTLGVKCSWEFCIFPRAFNKNNSCKIWEANRVSYGQLEKNIRFPRPVTSTFRNLSSQGRFPKVVMTGTLNDRCHVTGSSKTLPHNSKFAE